MTKLEKSIRRELKYFGPALRNGHYGLQRYTLGIMPKRGLISSVHCDVEEGEVTNIRIYCGGDALWYKDYYGDSIEITNAFVTYLKAEDEGWDWDALIRNIADEIQDTLRDETQSR